MALPRNVSLGGLEYMQMQGVGVGVDDSGDGERLSSTIYWKVNLALQKWWSRSLIEGKLDKSNAVTLLVSRQLTPTDF